MYQKEFDLGEVEIDFISFVPRGANRKKYFLVKEDRSLKDDILKSILETDEDDISWVLKEAGLEGEAAGVLEAAAKLLKAYKYELLEGSLQILATIEDTCSTNELPFYPRHSIPPPAQ
ncbi:MAG: hypothetical protein WBL87_06430 [Methanothrix sp.]